MQSFLRKSDIVREYGISYTTLRKWEKDGILTTHYGVLYTRSDVEEAINRKREKGGIEKRVLGKWKVEVQPKNEE